MARGSARKALIAAVLSLVLAPASASAWTVTIHVHGAGGVLETTNRLGGNQHQMNCLVEPDGKSNGSVTDCVGGTSSGLYNSGNVVRLIPQASATSTIRGWHFDHWTDSSAGGGLINCDPQETSGNFSSPTYCEFATFENLRADLYFKDTTGPNSTAINGGPVQGSTTSATTAAFTSFTASDDPDATFQCRLNPPGTLGTWGVCPASGASFSGLTQNGAWQLEVRAVDPSGNVDITPAVRGWRVDTTPPVIHIMSGPAEGSTTNSRSADLGVTTSDGTLVCTIDGTQLASCSQPSVHLSGLNDGQHTFSVRGVDAVGNSSAPLTRTWTVDTTPPPAPTIDGGPTGATNARTATFTVNAAEGTLTCKLDAVTTSCSGAHTGLADGGHTFTATAADGAGNQATATRTWTVDTTPPTVTISGGPTGATNATTATFTVATSDGTPSCTLDGNATACSGAHGGLADGPHTFSATATDGVGNTSAPVSRHWTVDTVAPDVSLLGGPAAGSITTTSSASFSFASTDGTATFQCKLDLGAFSACTSPHALADIPNGDHTFSVRAVDPSGNASPAVSRSWTVNNKDQDHDGFNTPADCNDADAGIHPGAADIPDDGIDQSCDAVDAHNADQDADGVAEGQDCDDHDATIHPGAVDTPGDGIDQDCDGRDAKVTPVPGGIRYKFSTQGAKTTAIVLKLKDLTAPQTTVKVTCKGKGCKFGSHKAQVGKSHTLDVRKLIKRVPFKAGQTLTIKISAPGHRAKAAKFTMRRGKLPKGGAFGPA